MNQLVVIIVVLTDAPKVVPIDIITDLAMVVPMAVQCSSCCSMVIRTFQIMNSIDDCTMDVPMVVTIVGPMAVTIVTVTHIG